MKKTASALFLAMPACSGIQGIRSCQFAAGNRDGAALRKNLSGRTILPVRIACGLAIFALSLCGCGYHVAGKSSALPSSWRTIAVPVFVNRTPSYRIEQRLTRAVVHEFLARTDYRIVPSPADADAVLRGEVTSIEASPLLFDNASGHVTTMLITLKLKVTLEDEKTKKTAYENDNFIFRDEYEISGDVNRFFQEQGPALDRMSRDFAADLVSRLTEAY